ncbi:hypothetical protein MRX96_036085 [Rhipicephalus microplus]
MHPTLPRRKKEVASPQKVVVLRDDFRDYEKVKKMLELGPKLYFEHHLKAADALEMGRMVADRAPEAEKACCIAECPGVIATARQKPQMLVREFVANTGGLVDYFVERKIRPLVADNEGNLLSAAGGAVPGESRSNGKKAP